MKVEKQFKRTVKAGLILFAAGALLGAVIVYAVTPSSTFYISSGVYPGAPSFTIWREGSNYFAKDDNGMLKYSGTNATTIIQSVVNNHGRIFFRDGTYEVKNIILVSNLVMEGESHNTILKLPNSADNHLLRVDDNVTSISITSLTLDGNAGQQVFDDRYCFFSWKKSIKNLTIENVVFTNFKRALQIYSFSSAPSANINIKNCRFLASSASVGMIIMRYIDNCAITGNYIESDGSSVVSSYALYCQGNNTVIDRNTINGTGAGICFYAPPTASSSTFYNIISNNNVYNLWSSADGSWAILAESGRTIVENNIVHDCARDAIVVTQGFGLKGCTVSGNTVYNCGTGATGVGIWVHGAAGTKVMREIAVTGNTVLNCVGGIVITYANYSSISGNTIADCVRHGIFLASSSHCVVDGNTVYGCDSNNTATYHGIFVSPGYYNIISNNICEDNDRYEIYLLNADYTLVSSCLTTGVDHEEGIIDGGSDNRVVDSYNGTVWIASYP